MVQNSGRNDKRPENQAAKKVGEKVKKVKKSVDFLDSL